MTSVLVFAGRAGSGAAGLAMEFCRRAGAEADIVFAGGPALPPGTWRRAWCTGALSGPQAAEGIRQAMCTTSYSLVLFDEGEGGREAAARVAVQLGLPVIAQVASIRLDRDGLRLTRSVDGGARTAVIAPRGAVTLAVVSSSVGGGGGEPGTAREGGDLGIRSAASLLEVISEYQPPPGDIELDQADVVVAGGRGVGGSEGFARLEELAALLGGTVGASRVAVDAGWVPYRRQVGLTGKTVAPRLYLACGISGAPHHVLGMRNSSLIVAINSDPQAPIFRLAHVSIVGKVEEVVPQIIGELRRRQDARKPVGVR